MNFGILRPFFSIFFFFSFGLLVTTAPAFPVDLEQKLLDTSARDPLLERQITQLLSSIERGQLDQVVQATTQQFFQLAPLGELSEASIELSNKRATAMARAGLLAQYLRFDLDGDGAVGKAEMEGLYGNDAASIVSLLGVSDQNSDGEISAEELRLFTTDQANQQQSRNQAGYLMAFDLDENGVVVVDELLKGLRMLADGYPAANPLKQDTDITVGKFVDPTEEHDPVVENPTNADGLPIELHMVGIYEPRNSRSADGLFKSGQVSIKVDRPGVAVTLVLGSYVPTRWSIETSKGTQVDKVIASDQNRMRGEVILNGQPVSVTYRKLPLAYQSLGSNFQPFHEAASKAAGVRNAASFQGAYTAPEGGFIIDEAPSIPTLKEVEAALTAEALSASELPPTLRSAFEGKSTEPGSKWTLREEGLVGVDQNKKAILYRLPLDAPEVSWPMGAAFDSAGQRVWGVTLGGEGYLYQYDIAKNQWSARSMNNVDVGGLIFNPKTGNLITTPGPTGASGYQTLDTSGKVLSTLEIASSDYPGLISTYDPGNGPAPRIVPVMVDGDLLLVRVDPWPNSQRTSKSQWVYLVNLQSGTVRLVR